MKASYTTFRALTAFPNLDFMKTDQKEHIMEPNPDFLRIINGYSLTTAEILYGMPDHPLLVQTFVWQDYDMHPRFPKLKKFLQFWTEKLDGPLYGVRVAHRKLVTPSEIKLVGGEFKLN